VAELKNAPARVKRVAGFGALLGIMVLLSFCASAFAGHAQMKSNVPIAAQIRRETGIPTRVVGLIATAQQAEDIVAQGKADMIALGRAMLEDPHWAWMAAKQLGAEVARPNQYLRAAPKMWPGAAYRGNAA